MTFRIDWKRALCDNRVPRDGDSGNQSPGDFRTPFEADYDRVVFSDPFRRLAKKTQVHPLAPNDHVHTRLTHSIESASVGRSFGWLVANHPDVRQAVPEHARHIPMIMQVACLAHDIGNPPFGHAGEHAIREWMSHEATNLSADSRAEAMQISTGLKRDCELFEGNAQGFRFASRCDNPKYGYIRLTYASLGSMVKYPWDSLDPRTEAKGKGEEKFNFFHSEAAIFHSIWSDLGLVMGPNLYARHPLSFLVEAADDICYRMLDMEDAVLMKICDEQRIRTLFCSLLEPQSPDIPLSVLRGKAIRRLIDVTWETFAGHYDAIMAGAHTTPLTKSFTGANREWLTTVKQIYGEIFAHRNKVAFELGAYRVLGRIMQALTSATRQLCETKDFEKIGFVQRRCMELAWGRAYAVANCDRTYAWWLQQTLDYVAGLTDTYALQVSAEIEGAVL